MASVKVFDKNAMIAVSKGELKLKSAEVHVVISIIRRLELLAWPELSGEDRDLVRKMVDSVETGHITPDVEERVIEIRSSRKLKLPDAVVAATATNLGVPLVTNDLAFAKVPGLLVESF